MKINEITLKPQMIPNGDHLRFRVGDPVVEGGHIVEKILFYPDNNLFNKGREVSTGCYSIFFVEISERRLVMSDTISSIEVVTEKKKKDNDIPELPDLTINYY